MGKSINVLELGQYGILCHCVWFRFSMSNILQSQSSPYLQQACQQPVNWQPWGKDAFSKARELDKPVIISIGYSSCHWCRQMSRDNYEDSYVASLMNRHFVCIKVDREERPDLDLFYMEASRMFNQSAGCTCTRFAFLMGLPFGAELISPRRTMVKESLPYHKFY